MLFQSFWQDQYAIVDFYVILSTYLRSSIQSLIKHYLHIFDVNGVFQLFAFKEYRGQTYFLSVCIYLAGIHLMFLFQSPIW